MKKLFVYIPVLVLALASSFAYAEDPPQFLFQWGGPGSGDGQFNLPMDVDIDPQGNVYIVEKYNHRIQKFTSRGEFILKWGSLGTGDGQFSGPEGLCVDNAGNVYVVDYDNDRIQKFTSDGHFIRKWGATGSGPGQFNRPVAIAADDDGFVYVSDYENQTIQKFDSTGVYVLTFAPGYGNGYYPCDGLTVGPGGLVYATAVDIQTSFINIYNTDGGYENAFGCSGAYPTPCAMSHPNDVDVDSDGNIYVVDNDWYRFVKWSPGLEVLYTRSTHGGNYDNPYGIAVNRWGWVYVAEQNSNTVQVFGDPTSGVIPPDTHHTFWSIMPNPLRNTGAVICELTNAGKVTLCLINVQGRVVRTILANQYRTQGRHEIQLDGKVPAGTYFLRLTTPDAVETRKVTILR